MITFYKDAILIPHFYAHGKLESILSTDLLGCNTKDVPIGIHPCKVEEYNCTYYSWIRNIGQCGLICLSNDKEANSYALRMFNNKATFI